ncbi:MAG TPA: hypothetical protein VHO50_08960 [Bacteroidales bacterium]|nr:hypothetical protein [Bacteroidales bacterium]
MFVGSSSLSALATGFPMGILAFVYIAIAVLFYFPVTYLYRFSVQMKPGLSSGDQPTVTSAFKNLKSMFRFMGIFAIVVLSLYGVILLGVMVVLIIK